MFLGFNKRFWSLVTCMVIGAITFVVYPGHAREQEPVPVQELVSIGGITDCGILPSSPLYFAKGWSRAGRLFFAFEDQKRAKLTLSFANEDILAIKELCDRKDYIALGKQCGKFQQDFQKAVGRIRQMRQEGENIEGLMDKVKEDHLDQQWVLASVLEEVPEWAEEGILITMESTGSFLESAIYEMQGKQQLEQFQQELIQQFCHVNPDAQNKIQGMLEASQLTQAKPSVPSAASPSDNQPPVVACLIIDTDELVPTGECHIECTAEDPDGDSLSYIWSASGGDIAGTGSSISWIAPNEAGDYDVMVTVSDEQGEEDTKSLTVSVELPAPPVIDEILLIPEKPQYFSRLLAGYAILRDVSCEIECIVSGGYNLSYEWTASEGDISGSGYSVTWTAPSHRCEALVTVTISDGSGRTATENIVFHVSTCAPCFL